MESALRPIRLHCVPPSASQERRKRRGLGGKKVVRVAAESLPTAAQERREGRRGGFDVSEVPIAANVATGP